MDNSRLSTVTGVLRLVFAFASILAAVIANNSLAQAPTQFAIKVLCSPAYAVTGATPLSKFESPLRLLSTTSR